MEKQFRVAKRHRNLAIVFTGVVLAMLVGSLFMVVHDVPANRQVAVALFFGGVWIVMLLIPLYELLHYYRSRLSIAGDEVSKRGVFKGRVIALTNLQSLNWRLMPSGGAIRVSNESTRITLPLSEYEKDEALQIIRFFREICPQDRQENWNLFCHKVAMPMLRQIEMEQCGHLRLQPRQIVVTRRRWDTLFGIATVIFTIVSVAIAFQKQAPHALAIPLGLIPIWLSMRYLTPKRGLIETSLAANPEMSTYLCSFAVWAAIGIAGVIAFEHNANAIPLRHFFAAVLILLWFAGLISLAVRGDKLREQRDRAARAASVAEWEERLDANGTSDHACAKPSIQR